MNIDYVFQSVTAVAAAGAGLISFMNNRKLKAVPEAVTAAREAREEAAKAAKLAAELKEKLLLGK